MEESVVKQEEIGEEIATIPEEAPQQPDTAALERELESLRAEKYQRLLLEQAKSALEERGIDVRFAPFVLAGDDEGTRKKVEQFDRQLSEAMKKHLAAHLPVGEPRDFAVSKPKKRVRGIRKM